MNKKFSTLLTGALLVGSLTANADPAPTGIDVTNVTKIEQLASGTRYYVLSTTKVESKVAAATGVYMDKATKGIAMAGSVAAFNTAADVSQILWSIKANSVEGSNRYVFTSKETGETLSFDPANAIDVSAGEVAVPGDDDKACQMSSTETNWTYVTNNDDATNLADVVELACAFHVDSTMQLGVNANGLIYAFKYANAATAKAPKNATVLKIQAVQPGTIILGAKDLNTQGEDAAEKYFTMGTGLTLKDNIFAGEKWQAQTIVATGGATKADDYVYAGSATSDLAATTDKYVVLNKIGSDGKPSFNFAHIDTAYWDGVSDNKDKWYKLAVAEGKATIASDVVTGIDSLARDGGLAQEAFEFQFTSNLFKDSVIVAVAAEALKEKGDATQEVFGRDTYWGEDNSTLADYITLSFQKLSDANVLTLDKEDQDNNIPFYLAAPVVKGTAAAVKDGVYYIQNKAGQFLAAPIYNTFNKVSVSDVKWVTVDGGLQEVAHMPAYQWVILKDQVYSETSPVTITNREFIVNKTVDGTSVQFNQKDAGSCLYVGAEVLFEKESGKCDTKIKTTDSLKLVQITDPAILGDSLLGYKNFEKDSLLVNRYTFNYLHDYADNKYIVKSSKDSLALATDGAQPLEIEPVVGEDIYSYGFKVTDDVAGRIKGLKQLYRRAYNVYVPTAKGKLYLAKNKENQYVFTSNLSATPFLFKEENDLTNNKHYHALLAIKESQGTDDEKYTKVGVSDASVVLKDQEMNETRTSTFFIGKYDAPLYRRFNSLKLEGNEGDAADTLRFVEKYRGEYLQIEANKNFKVNGIDFLGLYTPDFTKDGKSFIVDTALVNRDNGDLKPQYLISIDRTDKPAVPGVACTDPAPHYDIHGNETDAFHCIHATPAVPGFNFGKYLVNFADSVANATGNKDNYGWKGYTRAGFVKAAHMGDSLYILTGQFANVTPATFDTAAIKKAVKDGKYDKEYIKDLRGKEHKYVTWSMRFVNPAVAANEVEDDRAFLMESMKADEDNDIAPVNGSWLKMQNGCLVMSGSNEGGSSSFEEITNGDDALIFNVEKGNKDDFATENEAAPVVSEVKVIAANGGVQIVGAQGKKVVITNILGQTVANTVLTSSDATIATPAGVVVVAIEGEDAVKAIVK